MTSGPVDLQRFGREWAVLEELVAYRGVTTRDRMSPRVIDVHYRDLMADPVETVGSVLAFAGVPFTAPSRASVSAFAAENAPGRHRYTAEEFGLDAAGLRRRFAWYIERFGVPIEDAR
jgi:hypothetical protein